MTSKKKQMIPIKPEEGIPIVDCHCHFPVEKPRRGMKESYEEQYKIFFEEENGQFLITSAGIWGYKFMQKFVESHENMYITLGWGAQATTYATPEEWEKDYPRFIEYVKNNSKEIVAIGECGVDFHHAKTLKERKKQVKIFHEIIKETKHLNKPYVLHVRNPTSRNIDEKHPNHEYNEPDICNNIIIEILEEEDIPPNQVMWHCFSGPADWGPFLAKRGFYISIPSSAYGFNRWRRNIAGIPIENLLTETDSSYQHPYKMGAFNSPHNVKYSVAAIAYVNKMKQKDVATQIVRNAKKFFSIP